MHFGHVGLGLATLVSCALSGCDDPEPATDAKSVDGKICGYLSPALIESIVGHDDAAAAGDEIVPADERADREQECAVVDGNRTVVLAQVHDAPSTRPGHDAAPLDNCVRLDDLADWTGSVCWSDSSMRATVWPDNGARLLEVSYFPEGGGADKVDTRDELVHVTVSLARDVEANIKSYDERQQ